MMMEGMGLILICSSLFLLQVQVTGGQNQDALLFRLSNLESRAVSVQKEFTDLKARLAEINSRLDELSSSLAVQRPAFDGELTKDYISELFTVTLETIQEGLANEKQHRVDLEYMALETKVLINNQNELFRQETGLLKNRIEDNKELINNQTELFQKKTELLENRIEDNKEFINNRTELFQKKTVLLENRAENNKELINNQNKLFRQETGLLKNRIEDNTELINNQTELFQKKTRLLDNRIEDNKELINTQTELFQKKTGLLENRIEDNQESVNNQTELFPKKTGLLGNRTETRPTGYKGKDCWDLKATYGISKDGVYDILSPDGHKISLRCDMTTDGGGWTVFHWRGDGGVRFNNTYAEYKSFFGNLTGEFWMGNDFLNVFTRGVNQTLRVDICDWDNEARWAKYRHFSVGPSADKYRLGVEDYSGTAGDALITGYGGYFRYQTHNGQAFSAPGGDNDNRGGGDCSSGYQSGWWFNDCISANLNGPYRPETSPGYTGQGILWMTWIELHSFKGSEMKIRPSTSSTSSTNKPFNCPVI